MYRRADRPARVARVLSRQPFQFRERLEHGVFAQLALAPLTRGIEKALELSRSECRRALLRSYVLPVGIARIEAHAAYVAVARPNIFELGLRDRPRAHPRR